MYDTATSTLWNSEFALTVARRIASIHGVYCGPAAVAWIAAVWNARAGRSYDYVARLSDKQQFADGPRAFAHRLPGFRGDLDRTLQRETGGALKLSKQRFYKYADIHALIRRTEMPFVVRIPSLSIRDGLHYVTLFRSVFTGDTYRFYWQDNGVFRSDEKMQEGISVSVRSSRHGAFFMWGARQVVMA